VIKKFPILLRCITRLDSLQVTAREIIGVLEAIGTPIIETVYHTNSHDPNLPVSTKEKESHLHTLYI